MAGDPFTCFTLEGATALRDALRSFAHGRLVVNLIDLPVKCPVAPLEFCLLADWHFRRRGIRDQVQIEYAPRRCPRLQAMSPLPPPDRGGPPEPARSLPASTCGSDAMPRALRSRRLAGMLRITNHSIQDLRTFVRRERGAYLTDGRRLFRNLNPLRGSLGGSLVALEDCRTQQLVLMPVRDFARLQDVCVGRAAPAM